MYFYRMYKTTHLNQSVDESSTHPFSTPQPWHEESTRFNGFLKDLNGSAVLLIEMFGNESHG